MPYADLNNLKADYLPDLKSAADSAAVARILDAVSAFVDTYCRRPAGHFDPASSSASERRVRGEGGHCLRLPVHVPGTVSAVKVNGSTIDSANYYESEKNGWLYLENDPWTPERSLDEHFSEWTDGRIYKVTARWGYPATPADLQEAVRQTVAAVWDRQRGVLGELTPNGFVIERAMPLFAREVLDSYRRREFET